MDDSSLSSWRVFQIVKAYSASKVRYFFMKEGVSESRRPPFTRSHIQAQVMVPSQIGCR